MSTCRVFGKGSFKRVTEQALVASVHTLLKDHLNKGHNTNFSQPATVLGQMSKTLSETVSLQDPRQDP